MTVDETIRELVHYWPTTVPTRLDALDRLFCVGGSGYYWNGGEVVYLGVRGRELRDPVEWLRQKHAERDHDDSPLICELHEKMLAEDLAEVEAIHANEDAIVAGRHGPALADWHGFYPFFETANLCTVPPDVAPDWLAAAVETCERIIEYARLRPDQERFKGSQRDGVSVSIRNAELAAPVLAELLARRS